MQDKEAAIAAQAAEADKAAFVQKQAEEAHERAIQEMLKAQKQALSIKIQAEMIFKKAFKKKPEASKSDAVQLDA